MTHKKNQVLETSGLAIGLIGGLLVIVGYLGGAGSSVIFYQVVATGLLLGYLSNRLPSLKSIKQFAILFAIIGINIIVALFFVS